MHNDELLMKTLEARQRGKEKKNYNNFSLIIYSLERERERERERIVIKTLNMIKGQKKP